MAKNRIPCILCPCSWDFPLSASEMHSFTSEIQTQFLQKDSCIRGPCYATLHQVLMKYILMLRQTIPCHTLNTFPTLENKTISAMVLSSLGFPSTKCELFENINVCFKCSEKADRKTNCILFALQALKHDENSCFQVSSLRRVKKQLRRCRQTIKDYVYFFHNQSCFEQYLQSCLSIWFQARWDRFIRQVLIFLLTPRLVVDKLYTLSFRSARSAWNIARYKYVGSKLDEPTVIEVCLSYKLVLDAGSGAFQGRKKCTCRTPRVGRFHIFLHHTHDYEVFSYEGSIIQTFSEFYRFRLQLTLSGLEFSNTIKKLTFLIDNNCLSFLSDVRFIIFGYIGYM